MALVVEDGTGLASAEAYQSVVAVGEYATRRGLAWNVADVPACEAALRRAATWLDATYRTRLPGTKVRGRAQALEWPRKNAVDVAGDEIEDDDVPAEWLAANAEVAVRELASPGSLSPDVVVGRIEKSVSVSGAVSVTYAGEGDYVGSQRPTLTLVDDLLSSLFSDGMTSGRSVTKFLSRA